MSKIVKTLWEAKITLIIFLFFTAFWLYLQFIIPQDTSIHRFFGAIYGVIALVGGIWGFLISKKWGFLKSVIGRALFMFSLGLFAQEFGQIVLSYFDYVLHKEGLYPSLGDVGYFGSIIFYILGILFLAHASGVKVSLKSFSKKLQAVIIPLLLLGAGYYLFLQGYKVDWSNPIKVFLDFGYPLGQAIYISLAILTYLLSRGILGGLMKSKILLILFALCIQFASDYTFLYQSSKGTWQVGQLNDYMYFFAYVVMAIGLLQFKEAYNQLRKK